MGSAMTAGRGFLSRNNIPVVTSVPATISSPRAVFSPANIWSLLPWNRSVTPGSRVSVTPASGLSCPVGFKNGTDGNVRTFTETILKNVIQKVWSAGGTPKILMCGPVNKQRVSGFSGIASSRFNIDGGAKPATLVGAVDIYVSDFGNVQVIANRFQRERDAWVIDPDYAKMTVLRPYQQVELAKTGDAEKRMLIVEWGHKVLAENAHGLAADLITS